MPIRASVGHVAIYLFVTICHAQSPLSSPIQKLLPSGAKIIEIADLSGVVQKPREFVWMQDPEEVLRDRNDAGFCGDAVYGDHWVGPTRLSLVDSERGKLLNTLKIVGPAFQRDPPDSFRVPFLVGNWYYHVPSGELEERGLANDFESARSHRRRCCR
jgi:hypothetical protein